MKIQTSAISVGFLGAVLLLSNAGFAAPPKLLYQSSDSVIVRMGTDGKTVVWQDIGPNSKKYLHSLDVASGKVDEIKAPRRPFGPELDQGILIYGAGDLTTKVDVVLYDLATKKSTLLHKQVPWIVEPAVQVQTDPSGKKHVQAVWERPTNDNGDELSVYLYDGDTSGRGGFKVLASGPIFRKNDIPPEYYRYVHSEYPEISGNFVAFQNDEYGTPNIYVHDIKDGTDQRIAPSKFFQERPDIDGKYVAWEESEKGFAESDTSDIYLWNADTHEVKKLNPAPGFHYQVRVKYPYVIYGTKREPAAHTPSIRVFDIESGKEIDASQCFTGPIYDWTATSDGLYVAQRATQSSSRILYAPWSEIKNLCQ